MKAVVVGSGGWGTALSMVLCDNGHNDYVQDIVSVYGISEDEIKSLNREYKKIRDGYQLKVRNTKEATRLIVEHQDLFTDYEVVKGGMDDVFLAVTGKRLGGEH